MTKRICNCVELPSERTGERGRRPSNDRAQIGFTMTEMLAVIAIMAVVAGLVFVSLTNIVRDMQQVELDSAAREIFVVAQNHLSAAESEGLLASKLSKGTKVESSLLTQDESSSGGNIYYFMVDGTVSTPSSSGDILAQMLPIGAIDETISSGGAYVIKYNAESATVLGVFYAAKKPATLFTASTSDFAFGAADYEKLFPGSTGYDASGHREFTNQAGKTAMLGYYGGSDRDVRSAPAVLKRPTLEIVNAERLVAVVSNPMSSSDLNNYDLTLQLVITGETSGNERVVDVLKKSVRAASGKVRISESISGKYEVFLDEIALSGDVEAGTVSHFADLFGKDEATGTGALIPGENITVQVKMFSTSKLTNIAYSTKATCNSLFGSFDASKSEVTITNLRHLENLGTKISGFNPNDTSNDGWKGVGGPKKARQVGDLSWDSFASEVAEGGSDARTVRVLKMGGETRDGAVSGPFVPVDLPDGFTYDAASDEGAPHAISGIAVTAQSGDAGVFESCKDGKISNLEIVNPSIAAQDGNAGGLVGSLANATVENVLVRHDAEGQASSFAVSGSVSAGGLVGSMLGGAVSQSAAALMVQATGSSAAAGGLVGVASGEAKVSKSYSGGHTGGGAYTGTANVTASVEGGVAGGLVGTLVGAVTSVTDCYSTCSASGYVAGGLVGSVAAGSSVGKGADSSAYSYATGKVTGTTTGAFVGMNEGSVTGRYLEIENLGMAAAGAGAGDAADCRPMDASASEFQSLSGSGSSAAYDKALIPAYQADLEMAYQGKYPFKNIAELCNDGNLPSFLATHYGDWPATETMVVNVPAAQGGA